MFFYDNQVFQVVFRRKYYFPLILVLFWNQTTFENSDLFSQNECTGERDCNDNMMCSFLKERISNNRLGMVLKTYKRKVYL